jgi:hypothetical protein
MVSNLVEKCFGTRFNFAVETCVFVDKHAFSLSLAHRQLLTDIQAQTIGFYAS